ncbi:Carboxy-terminal domain RNA polymerase II polypeptide A small phosphatase [Seminavis robusta]|uniref:Mitochondrial import inner membrane translocase subunit TIM50 n=1 Tax=Seminavis robusta TaxID=568900 RepID=A0A9N8HKL9_9STRA|nr:Carboxy-terminal domain RNA polymerase II polypeptide A small phosphatase [Seminavis robusta]|eukprot:Sro623_g177210.1 Carboxy-terminal domain RNA polymerase II polypeptide A small phosphatase (313) ;mRNA; f:50436-51374
MPMSTLETSISQDSTYETINQNRAFLLLLGFLFGMMICAGLWSFSKKLSVPIQPENHESKASDDGSTSSTFSHASDESSSAQLGQLHVQASKKQTSDSSSDLMLFLDLDKTLIYSDRGFARPSNKDDDYFFITLPTTGSMKIHKRPHLDHFLKTISSRFEVYIFTASESIYADKILDHLDPHGSIFSGRWYRQSCSGLQKKHPISWRKDVLQLGIPVDPKRFILVDDIPYFLLANPSNGIPITPFENTDPTDDFLLSLQEYLIHLDEEHNDDVRPSLEETFLLPSKDAQKQWFKKGKSFHIDTSNERHPPTP